MSDLLAGIRVLESAVFFNGDTLGAHLSDLGVDGVGEFTYIGEAGRVAAQP